VSFQLSAVEARYLTERIRFSVPSSLLAFLVEHARSLDGEFPWEHPQVSEFPEAVRSALAHAQCFAEAMNSASLLYNLMLAEEMPEGPPRTERVEDFRDRLSKLRESLRARDRALGEWDRSAFWHLVEGIANLRPPTRTFVNDWLALEPWARPADFVDAPAVRALIRDRELQLKGKARARLGNPGAIDNWNGEAGTAMLEYRWIAAQRILRDILSVEVE
jgi:hypothetical protein